jgi:hypothetical protein
MRLVLPCNIDNRIIECSFEKKTVADAIDMFHRGETKPNFRDYIVVTGNADKIILTGDRVKREPFLTAYTPGNIFSFLLYDTIEKVDRYIAVFNHGIIDVVEEINKSDVVAVIGVVSKAKKYSADHGSISLPMITAFHVSKKEDFTIENAGVIIEDDWKKIIEKRRTIIRSLEERVMKLDDLGAWKGHDIEEIIEKVEEGWMQLRTYAREIDFMDDESFKRSVINIKDEPKK